ncbi:alanine/glycine:cation symporter family protein [Anaerophilus nitritogenes]|uniref:alanine/glycine:cation symporter family protein n=1 Tax=Anaerophilus nitritogenes TaxID=2498136 RepID=UPI00101D975C|nr:sodium:alanine symporter family protein [Anaerophilus nitritogenes]
MEAINGFISMIRNFVWGPIMILLLVGTGVFLTIGTRAIQFRKLGYAFKMLFSKENKENGDISSFQALMTSLAATIGTGNIAGVATAISIGGPGSIFWMWITAAIGGATKFCEAFLAIRYRITNEKGEKSGGPMYYASMGMKERYGGNWNWLGYLFAVFGFFASFGTGNLVQANSVASSLKASMGLSPYICGIILSITAGIVIIGGIKSIAKITDKLVPTMGIIYILGSLVILINQHHMIPKAFYLIFSNAFNGKAVSGGFIGAVLRMGVARGIFSNEAGLGSSPIIHAASKNNDPIKEGLISSLGCFFATLIICTMTALVILVSGLISIDKNGLMMISDNLSGAALTTVAFNSSLPNLGAFTISFGLIFFAFSTILGWYYYGAKCLEYIAGVKAINIYKWCWIFSCFIGSIVRLDIVWNLSDALNGLMAIPNLIALIALGPMIFHITKKYEYKKNIKNPVFYRPSHNTKYYIK